MGHLDFKIRVKSRKLQTILWVLEETMGYQVCTKSARKKLALGHLVLNCCDYHMHIYGARTVD